MFLGMFLAAGLLFLCAILCAWADMSAMQRYYQTATELEPTKQRADY